MILKKRLYSFICQLLRYQKRTIQHLLVGVAAVRHLHYPHGFVSVDSDLGNLNEKLEGKGLL